MSDKELEELILRCQNYMREFCELKIARMTYEAVIPPFRIFISGNEIVVVDDAERMALCFSLDSKLCSGDHVLGMELLEKLRAAQVLDDLSSISDTPSGVSHSSSPDGLADV